ncbi:IncI1 plasmid conjugative transfer protein TraH [Serratia fonticola AU-AP2C]|nr:IncI1 plasmid conjugative transfer protein TraH [Serratia fonticola AU-AP2C]
MPLKNTDTQYNAEQIQNAQNNLYLSGAINQVRSPLFTPGISANSQRVTVNWDGDAVELLSHLARQRGLTFNWTGVRLPLPVNLHVNGVTYQNLLRMIEVQTAWRATLHEFPGQLTLAFSQPEKPRVLR